MQFKRIAKKHKGVLYKDTNGCLTFYTKGAQAILVKDVIIVGLKNYDDGSQTAMRLFQTSTKEIHQALYYAESISTISY